MNKKRIAAFLLVLMLTPCFEMGVYAASPVYVGLNNGRGLTGTGTCTVTTSYVSAGVTASGARSVGCYFDVYRSATSIYVYNVGSTMEPGISNFKKWNKDSGLASIYGADFRFYIDDVGAGSVGTLRP